MGTLCFGQALPLVTCDKQTSACRIMNISLGLPSLYVLVVTGVDIDLVGGLGFLLGANKNN